MEAATRWLRETGSSELREPYTYVTPEDWGAAGGHPLGVWIADQRRYYAAGTLEAARVAELEALGMVWSVQASAWEAGLAVVRSYAEVHGHLLPPTTAVWGGDNFPIGVWLKNQRAAARKAAENTERRAAGERASPTPESCHRPVWRPWPTWTPGGARCGTSPGNAACGSPSPT
ncbi:helicase associated domain-containing protein [Streptomyces sp. NPDC054804]